MEEDAFYEDEFEEFRVRANSGGALPEKWRRRKEMLDRKRCRVGSDCSYDRPVSSESRGGRNELLSEALVKRMSSLRLRDDQIRAAQYSRFIARRPRAQSDQPRASDTENDTQSLSTHETQLDLSRPMRPRGATMPSKTELSKLREKFRRCSKGNNELRRVRSFKITSKGIVKTAQSIVVPKTESLTSLGQEETLTFDMPLQTESEDSLGSSHSETSNEHGAYNVAVLGSHGVGKKLLIHRFMAMESGNSAAVSFDDDEEKTVSILLEGEESTMRFAHLCGKCELPNPPHQAFLDAYVIVYSVIDRKSFQDAIDILFELQKDRRQHAVILVANKTDLVRSRDISHDEGKVAAESYECKYAEVSALLMHQVDELLVGILQQIRLIGKRREKPKGKYHSAYTTGDDTCCLATKYGGLLGRLLGAYHTRSCDNLMVL